MKKLLAKVDTYTKEGQSKNKYVELGVVQQSNDGGEYMLLDPTVNLAGVLVMQNALAFKEGKQARTNVMVSVFDNSQQAPQQQGYQQAPQQGGFQQQAPKQQGGFQQQSTPQQQSGFQQGANGNAGFNDDIAFAPIAKQYKNLINCI